MIVLLNCSTSWCRKRVFEPDTLPSIGVLEQQDTIVSIPINYVKIANSKMLELKYEKEINANLRSIILNDSITINALNNELYCVTQDSKAKIKKIKKERNYAIVGASVAVVLLFVALFK